VNNLLKKIKKLDKIMIFLFLLSIFLFKIPSFYIFPFFKSAFLTSQALSRIIIILTFIYQITIHSLFNKKLFINKHSRLIILFILFFFILQSLSIFSAININSFLSRYKDIVISFLSFFVFFFYKKYYQQIIVILLISVIFNSIYQFFMVFYQDYFIKVISNFVYQKHVDLVIAKLQQNKAYLDTYDEIILPFLFVYPFKNKLNKNLSFYILFIVITSFSLLSNIRSRILMFFVSLGGTFVFFKKLNLKKILILLFSFIVISFLINNLMRYYSGFSFVDRLLLEDEMQDIKPVNFRLDQIKKSIEMSKASFFGVGLGNYFDNLSSFSKNNFNVNKQEINTTQAAQEFVHNIFGTILVETGYLSLLVFFLILIFFIRNDIFLLTKGKYHQKAFIIAFWSLFSYGLFNPVLPASYQILFWGIRGLLT